jgi:ectoine hydroxylase-related dioxygenase (phytanoyl-CoA dioxygenase family)
MSARAGTAGDIVSVKDTFWARGYAVLPGVIDHDTIKAFWSEFELMRESDPLLVFSEYGNLHPGPSLSREQKLRMRVTNLQNRSPRARDLATHPAILAAFQEIYGYEPACIQTLTYSQSSRQGAHSDMYLVSPPWIGTYDRDTLCASWVACEDASQRNGALVVYPGSHRIRKPKLEDCGNDYGTYVKALAEVCRGNGIEPELFLARKGDVLLWHADFIHAGSDPLDNTITRASFVCHYARIPNPQQAVPGRATFMTSRRKYVLADEAS